MINTTNPLQGGRTTAGLSPGTSIMSRVAPPPIDVSLGGAQNPTASPTVSYNKSNTGFLGVDWSNLLNTNGAGAIGSAIGQIGGSLISGELRSDVGDFLQGLSGVASNIPGFGPILSAGLGVLGGVADRAVGSKLNEENIAKVKSNISNLKDFQSNASDFNTLAQNWANADIGMTFDDSFIGEDGWFAHTAENLAADLREQVDAGNTWVNNTLINNADNIASTQMLGALRNSAAFGGPLFAHGGSIHIKPENKGKFTETKKRTGKTTEELTHSSNPLTRKRAIFAQNAKKWHHAFGGELNTQGGDFTNSVIYIDNGGSHETNPLQGVPMGMDEGGVPNLVEEGETIFNGYVFSRRLKVPKSIRNKYKLRDNISFADASKKLSKESEERPNDPISKRGLEAIMADLASSQEALRAKSKSDSPKNPSKAHKFAEGSSLSTQMRYAPVVAQGLATFTDLLGITNKPEYSNAESIRSASSGSYQPVSFTPVTNYLTYKPLDKDYYINKMSAEAGATRRSLLNTSGGNRATAMAGLLAAGNNYLNQIGGLARQAEEYNLAQRAQVEEFNRGTNTTNSQGFLQAATANQKALMSSRELSLKGITSAAEMREKIKLESEKAKSANLSGFVTSLGNVGSEEVNNELVNYALNHGLFGTGAEDGYFFAKKNKGVTEGRSSANGGKLKRKKGLTI